jgi:hypothetical protein
MIALSPGAVNLSLICAHENTRRVLHQLDTFPWTFSIPLDATSQIEIRSNTPLPPPARPKRTQAQPLGEVPWHPPSTPELRVSTVTPASIECLHRAGAWVEVSQHSATFSTMQASCAV